MKAKLLKLIKQLDIVKLSSDTLADYAYALECCRFASSVVLGDQWSQSITSLCETKLTEINSRMEGEAELSNLVMRHSMSKQWYEIRRKKGMETFTRVYQWRVVNELLNRNESEQLAQLFLLAEYLEAENYAHNLRLSYEIGQRLTSFNPSVYPTDDGLIAHIKNLSQKADYLSREELIEIADHIQTEIVEPDKTKEHLPLVSAILNTGMPCLNYPKIAKGLETATNPLSKTSTLSDIELAPVYLTLWTLTLNSSYLNRFEKTVRQCYLTLDKGKSFPNLGVDVQDPHSINSAVKFLKENRQTLWIINDRYNVDKVIEKYQPVLH